MARRLRTDWDALEFTRRGWDDFAGLLRWSAERDVVGGVELTLLARHAAERPEAARDVVDRAQALRRVITQAFEPIARGGTTGPEALEQLNRAWRSAALQRRLAPDGDGFGWTWRELILGDAPLERVLWPVIQSAVELLTAPELARLKVCDADDCGWMFIDASKNRSRRWCDMSDCGNRAKVRRFRQRASDRVKGRARPSPGGLAL